jgi:Leucine-rich repeat (LRR) protein
MNHLTDIDFHNVDLRDLDETTFEFCASTLEKLSLSSYYKYSKELLYTSALFNKLINLNELKLSNGTFQDNEDIFKNLTKLTKLDLSYAQIKELKRDSFKWLVNLINLDLSNNDFTHIEPGSFNGLFESDLFKSRILK